jgi:hypothetical protein
MATEREAMMLAVEALQMAHAGLEWYRDMHSDSVNASDDEADEKIGAALVALDEAMLAAPANTDSVYSGLALTEGLRQLASGSLEWQVRDPVEHCMCMIFTHADSIDPEGAALEWLRDFKRKFPDHPHAKYEVAAVRSFTPLERAALDAADLIDAMQARDSLVATASQHEKTPASGSSTAVSGEEARDAARYRGMRATLIGGDMHNFARMIALVACFFDSSDKFDAAIDSALQASNGLAAPSGSGSEGEGVKEVPRG